MSEDYRPADRARNVYQEISRKIQAETSQIDKNDVTIHMQADALPIGGDEIKLPLDDYPYFREVLISTYAVRQGMIDDV